MVKSTWLSSAFLAVILSGITASNSAAASFDCDKATTWTEMQICYVEPLSALDDALTTAYTKARNASSEPDTVTSAQRSWLKDVRNKCESSDCLREAYTARILELDPLSLPKIEQPPPPHEIVTGRCHMLKCWWWGIDNTEVIRSDKNGRLVTLTTRTTEATFSEAYYDREQYPDLPAKNALWGKGELEKISVFCSERLPVVIMYDQEKSKYVVESPFGEDGYFSGATEGIAHLYFHVCLDGKESLVPYSSHSPIEPINDPIEIFGRAE